MFKLHAVACETKLETWRNKMCWHLETETETCNETGWCAQNINLQKAWPGYAAKWYKNAPKTFTLATALLKFHRVEVWRTCNTFEETRKFSGCNSFGSRDAKLFIHLKVVLLKKNLPRFKSARIISQSSQHVIDDGVAIASRVYVKNCASAINVSLVNFQNGTASRYCSLAFAFLRQTIHSGESLFALEITFTVHLRIHQPYEANKLSAIR